MTGLLACRHKVAVHSVPEGASLLLNGEPIGATPQELDLVWVPFKELTLTADARGYRSVSISLEDDLSLGLVVREFLTLRWGRLFGKNVRSEHEFLFIREHGEAGSWGAEDARRN